MRYVAQPRLSGHFRRGAVGRASWRCCPVGAACWLQKLHSSQAHTHTRRLAAGIFVAFPEGRAAAQWLALAARAQRGGLCDTDAVYTYHGACRTAHRHRFSTITATFMHDVRLSSCHDASNSPRMLDADLFCVVCAGSGTQYWLFTPASTLRQDETSISRDQV